MKWIKTVCFLALFAAIIWVPAARASPSDVQLIIRTDKTTYETGELVQIYVLLWNGSPIDATLHFGSACNVGFSVEDLNGRSLYNQSIPYTECLTPPNLTVLSGQTFSFAFLWNQTDSTDKQVNSAQSYLVKGFLSTIEQFPPPITIINIDSGVETSTDSAFDSLGRFYQTSPPVFLLLLLIASTPWSWKLRPLSIREKLWFLIPPVVVVSLVFYIYAVFLSPQYFQNGYLRYPISPLLQTATITSLVFSALSLSVLGLSLKIDLRPRVLWTVSTSFLAVSYFLAFSSLNILAMEWRTFLEYDWTTSMLNSLVGFILVPLGFILETRVFGARLTHHSASEKLAPSNQVA